MQKPRPNFLSLLLREAPVLVPAGIVYAIVQGGDLTDWLIAIGGVALVGFLMAVLLYNREGIKQRPMQRRPAAKTPASRAARRRK